MTNFWQGKRVLVTGHTGFKGSWLSLWLHSLGAEVFGFALEPDTQPSLFDQLDLAAKIHHKIGDICDPQALSDYLEFCQPDVVFHLAAQPLVLRGYREAPLTWNTNIMGTVNLLEAARHLKHPSTIIAVTTDKVYHNRETNHFYSEDDRLGGLDPYSASKAATELAIQSYRSVLSQEERPVKLVSARAGNVIGGGDWAENRLIPDIVRALSKGESIEVRNHSAVRPWQHVLEPLFGYMCLAEHVTKGTSDVSALNFGPNQSEMRSVGDVVECSMQHWAGTYHKREQANAPHEAGLLMLSIEKAKEVLGWEPKWDFSQTVEKTMAWYKEAQNGADILSLTKRQIEEFENA
ncbi:CDP-glucose 4,6-dehydratase [Pseudophaeobacter sp.]|uniref:CDP-glucose 4,6-dehydratase n=1 Tax=Pseudophaeobacter sp. TaxID=1971739 RepID=UPI0032990E86